MRSSSDLRRVSGLPEAFSPWQIDPNDIHICTRPNGESVSLGCGGFGQVHLAMLKGVIPVAVKQLKADHHNPVQHEAFMREVALLKELNNSNIVQFQGASFRDDEHLLVTEYMEGGDLFKAISKKTVNWQQR